jgi:GNAT superfamily N-acetyltransferase
MTMTIEITPLRPDDRQAWDVLARGYKHFYQTNPPDADYDMAWQRLMLGERVHGLGARLDGRLVGITHYFFHASTWAEDVCYLQDLFVDPQVRGHGAARALIEAVGRAAKARGAARMYWLTHETNAPARTLYDKLAAYQGFIRYEYPMA